MSEEEDEIHYLYDEEDKVYIAWYYYDVYNEDGGYTYVEVSPDFRADRLDDAIALAEEDREWRR